MRSKHFCLVPLLGCTVLLASQTAARDVGTPPLYGEFVPKKFALGAMPTIPMASYTDGETVVSLTPDLPCATLDYGFEMAGQPMLHVQALSGPVEVEAKYAEAFTSLSQELSDGPFSWTAPLANSHRVQTFRFSTLDESVTTLTQGGQRWQTLCLLTGDGVSFKRLAFRATVPVVESEASALPGSFVSSDATYNKIWDLGPRAASVACIAAESQPEIWSVDAENGTYVPGTRPGISYKTWNLTDYVLEFETKLVRGGMGVTIGFTMADNSDGIQLHLASEYPNGATYSNTNTSLFPPSTIRLAYGYDFVNITTATSYLLDLYQVPFRVPEDEWLAVKIEADAAAHRLSYWLNDTLVFNATVDSMANGDQVADPTASGAFGFGGWQDQAAFVRNVVATSRLTGEVLYANPMTDATVVLPEFGEQTNSYGVCMDGGKRDRLMWLGDFYHTTRILGVGQGIGFENAVTGTWRYVFDYQSSIGQFPGFLPISYETPMPTPGVFMANAGTSAEVFVFPDYAVLGLLSFVSYMEYSNDVAFASEHWSSFAAAMAWLGDHKTNDTGLLDFSDGFVTFIGPAAGVAVNAASVQAYRGMARVAEVVGDVESAATWTASGEDLAAAININLWNDELGVYSVEAATPDVFGVSGIAFAITAGVANESQALRSLAHLDELKQGPGYLDTSATDPSTKISPNTNGFLLDALLQLKQTAPAKFLLDNLWGAMLNDSYASGASWEYVAQDLSPGLSDFTSLAHPWGGAASYALTNFVAGIRPVDFGFATWIIEPIVAGFGLDNVSSKVTTPFGTLSVNWALDNSTNSLLVTIASPAGTSGVFQVDQLSSNSTFTRNITGGGSDTFTIQL